MSLEPFHHPLSLLYGFLALGLGKTFGAILGIEDVFVAFFLDHRDLSIERLRFARKVL